MALLDKGFKQRIVGALVLVALAVIFLPMLLSRQEEGRRDLEVDAPAMPEIPPVAQIRSEPVEVPVALLPDEPVPVETDSDNQPEPQAQPQPVVSAPVVQPPPVAAAQASAGTPSRLDADILPVSWSIQLASLSSSENAQRLQQELRNQGYNAYIRNVEGMNRVFVGPVIERAEANRLRDQLNRQKKLSGIVVRFQPERS
jgi:DedD protein